MCLDCLGSVRLVGFEFRVVVFNVFRIIIKVFLCRVVFDFWSFGRGFKYVRVLWKCLRLSYIYILVLGCKRGM